MLVQVIAGALAALGFSVLFNVRGRKILLAALGGLTGWVIHLMVLRLGGSVVAATFVASVGIGLYAELLAHLAGLPATLFIVSAIIPLVPGGGLYATMNHALRGQIPETVSMGMQTVYLAGAIATGVALVSSLRAILGRGRRRPGLRRGSRPPR
ncbi:MAG: threonine/serine exporter family protein [Spirochaetales bacterium]|nr:threonine/serine exporter family protein [Spirochaetales bacterium]